MRVLVTGGSGFLGFQIVQELVRAGHEVVALVRPTSERRRLETLPGVTLVVGAVDEPDSLAEPVRRAEAVVHAAALIKARSARDFQAVNVDGTRNLLDAARHASLRRFVFVSSLAAAGPSPDGRPITPEREGRPLTAYGRSKLAAEGAVLASAARLPVVIVRPPPIYGPGDRGILPFFQAIHRGVFPCIEDGRATFSLIHVADCAAACARAAEAALPSGRVYFVEDGEIHTLRGLLEDIERALGRRAWLRLSLPPFALRLLAAASEAHGRLTGRPARFTRDKAREILARHWVCDGSATRAELGWEPRVPWSEGVRATADWYRAAGWL